MLIYRITNTVNRKVYLGKTRAKTPNHRWSQHTNSNLSPIGMAIQKYGKENFIFEILISNPAWTETTLGLVERKLISIHNTSTPHGYNVTEGGDNGLYGDRHWARINPEKFKSFRAHGFRHGSHTHPERVSRGENNAKLTEDQVRQIRIMKQTLSSYVLAEMFGVAQTTISAITTRKNWRHI